MHWRTKKKFRRASFFAVLVLLAIAGYTWVNGLPFEVVAGAGLLALVAGTIWLVLRIW